MYKVNTFLNILNKNAFLFLFQQNNMCDECNIYFRKSTYSYIIFFYTVLKKEKVYTIEK